MHPDRYREAVAIEIALACASGAAISAVIYFTWLLRVG